MKTKLILLLLSIVISGNIFAQHLSFMGIPIDGTMEDFSKQLEAKGFKKATKTSMKGYFGGYYCTITLLSNNSGTFSHKEDIMGSVQVKFNEYLSINNDIFHNLSRWLSMKYGNFEEYHDSYIKTDNGYKVCINRAWCTEGGTIVLHNGNDVQLSYIDRVKSSRDNDNQILNDL